MATLSGDGHTLGLSCACIACCRRDGLMQGKGPRRTKDPDEMYANVIYAWALGRHFVLLSRRLGLDTACSDIASF